MLECVERLRSFTHAFRPFSHGQSRLHLGIPPIEERRRQLAVALLRGDLDRHASLPSRPSVDRQDGADGCAVSDTGPVKTAADQVETDPGVESQGQSQAQLALQRLDFPWLRKEMNW